jgi:hypothetical protein
MKTPSGITQHAIGAILNTTIENLHAPAFITYKLRKSTMQYEQIMALDHYCNQEMMVRKEVKIFVVA